MKENTMISLEEFKSRLQFHTFSFEIQDELKNSAPHEDDKELLAMYVQAQQTEARMIFPDAFAGGDDYMVALAEAQAKAIKRIVEKAVRKVPSHYLEVKVFKSLSTELQDFITMLYHHDWYYDYSDDNKVWRAGQAKEAAIQAALKKGGEEYTYWYDKFKPIPKVN